MPGTDLVLVDVRHSHHERLQLLRPKQDERPAVEVVVGQKMTFCAGKTKRIWSRNTAGARTACA